MIVYNTTYIQHVQACRQIAEARGKAQDIDNIYEYEYEPKYTG